MSQLFPQRGAEIELLDRVADTSKYADANLFFDATPAIRFGISGQYTQVHYLDGNRPPQHPRHGSGGLRLLAPFSPGARASCATCVGVAFSPRR